MCAAPIFIPATRHDHCPVRPVDDERSQLRLVQIQPRLVQIRPTNTYGLPTISSWPLSPNLILGPKIIRDLWNEDGAMSFTWNSAPFKKDRQMVSGAYLRQQAEILIAMSRATFDLGVAGRLRAMASELQTRAAEQDAERGFADNEMASFKRPVRIGT